MTTTTEKPVSPFAGFEFAIIAEPGEQAHKLIFADWLEDNAEADNDYAELSWYVRWMGDEGVDRWPVKDVRSLKGNRYWWSQKWVEASNCNDYDRWPRCSEININVWRFVAAPEKPNIPNKLYSTLLDALRAYYSAYQARQLMRDGKRVARVPKEVVVCPMCGMELYVTSVIDWSDDGFPIKGNLSFREGLWHTQFNVDSCRCKLKRSTQYMPVAKKIYAWCHAVE